MSAQVIELHNNDHLAQVEAAKQWLDQHMPGDVKAAREARNRMILALNQAGKGYSNRVIADALECDEGTVRNALRNFSAKGEEVQRNDPRGGARKPAEAKPRTQESINAQAKRALDNLQNSVDLAVAQVKHDTFDVTADLTTVAEEIHELAQTIAKCPKPTKDEAATTRAALVDLQSILQTLIEGLDQ